jgi:predicted DNA-binding transcriptional regulator AlpA
MKRKVVIDKKIFEQDYRNLKMQEVMEKYSIKSTKTLYRLLRKLDITLNGQEIFIIK